MSAFLQQFAAPFLLGHLVYLAVDELILSVALVWLGKRVLKAMGHEPNNTRLYWLAGTGLVFVSLLCLSLLWSFVSQQQLSALAERERESDRPVFRVTLHDVISATAPARQGGKVPFASIIASISNTGAPSVISELRFTAKVAGGAPVLGLPHEIPDGFKITYADGTVETLSSVDALTTYQQGQPIQKGGRVWGRMLYLFPAMSATTFDAAGTTYELTVTDIWGRQYKASFKNTGEARPRVNFPHMRPRFPEPLKPAASGSQHETMVSRRSSDCSVQTDPVPGIRYPRRSTPAKLVV